MCQNPALVESLAKDHLGELRRTAAAAAQARRGDGRARVLDLARRRAGWALVDVGLHLVGASIAARRSPATERRPPYSFS